MMKHFGLAMDTSGNALAHPTITVYRAGTTTLASIFSDNVYTVLANPFTGHADGTYEFYARNGRYDIVVTKTGFAFDASNTYDTLLHDPSTILTPATLSADQNDYAPPNGLDAAVWRLQTDGTERQITGIAAGNPGQILTLINVGATAIGLATESALSSAVNRIITATGAKFRLPINGSARLVYDSVASRWRLVAFNSGNVSLTIDRSSTDVIVTNTNVETTLYAIPFIGGQTTATSRVRCTLLGRIQNATAGAETLTFRLKYGTATPATLVMSVAAGMDAGFELIGYLSAENSTTAQQATLRAILGTQTGCARGTSAVDQTVTQTFLISAQWTSVSASLALTMEHVVLELMT